MQSLNSPLIKINNLCQVCMVVHDVEKTMRTLWNTFGIGPWDIYRRDPNSKSDSEFITDMTYYGRPARFGYIMASTRGRVGDSSPFGAIKMELLQPLQGDSIHHDFLRDRGEGIEHLGWHVVDSMGTFNQTKEKLEKEGFPCITSARLYNSAFAFFDTTKVLRTYLEMVCHVPNKSRPAPSSVFPE